MKRHVALKTLEEVRKERERRHLANEPPRWEVDEGLRTCICNPDKPFYSIYEFKAHQAEEYERLIKHYPHFFEP